MTKVNSQSDFAIRLRLFAEDPDNPDMMKELGCPTCDFIATLAVGNPDTAKVKFIASHILGEEEEDPTLNNLVVDEDGRLVIYVDNHNLGRGDLYITLNYNVLAEEYADEFRRLVFTARTGIELVNMKSEDPLSPIDLRINLPSAFISTTALYLSEDYNEELEGNLDAMMTAYNDAHEIIRAALADIGVETDVNCSFTTMANEIKKLTAKS